MKQNRGDLMDKTTRTLLVSIIVNMALVISKLIIGFLGSSRALIANGIHSLTDMITDIIAIVGNNLSRKPADTRHPYGYGQIEYVTNIIMGLTILILGVTQIFSAFSSNIDMPSNIIIYVSIIAMVVKYTLSRYITLKGKKYKSGLLIVSGFESKADALTTLFVIISALLSKLTVYNELYKYSDNVCTFVIGLYISYVSLKILKENAFDLIDKVEDNQELINKIKKKILKNDEIKDVTSLSLIKYGTYYTANVEIALNKNTKLKDIKEINKKLEKQLVNRRTRISYLVLSTTIYEGSE